MLIGKATKEQVAECGRLLALNLAHYQAIHGEIPLDDTLAMLDMAEPNEAQVKLVTDGMQNLVGVLGNVCSGLGVISKNFLDAVSGANLANNHADRDPHASDASLASHDVGLLGDAIELRHDTTAPRVDDRNRSQWYSAPGRKGRRA